MKDPTSIPYPDGRPRVKSGVKYPHPEPLGKKHPDGDKGWKWPKPQPGPKSFVGILLLLAFLGGGIFGCSHQHWGTINEGLTWTKDEVRECLTIWPEVHALIRGGMQQDYDTKLTQEQVNLMKLLDDYAAKLEEGVITDIELMEVAGLKIYIVRTQIWPILAQYVPDAIKLFRGLL